MHALRALVVGGLLLAASAAAAQEESARVEYQVHSWASFEQGQIPENLKMGHNARAGLVDVFPLGKTAFSEGSAEWECGSFAVALRPGNDEQSDQLSLTSTTILQRDRLGDSGTAIIQTDIYIPADDHPTMSFAATSLVAVLNEGGKKYDFTFYRTGFLPNRALVFTFVDTRVQKEPIISQQVNAESMPWVTPGWHRLQIIFRGQAEISCAVDGRELPLRIPPEGSLKTVSPGVLVTNYRGDMSRELVSLVDNLSIQWSPVRAPVPDSPWASPRKASTLGVLTNQWNRLPNAAWQLAQAEGKPLLCYFHSSKAESVRQLEVAAVTTPSIPEALSDYVLLALDTQQLEGIQQAQKFNVMRVPTLVVLGTDGQVARKMTVSDPVGQQSELLKFLTQERVRMGAGN